MKVGTYIFLIFTLISVWFKLKKLYGKHYKHKLKKCFAYQSNINYTGNFLIFNLFMN